MVSGMGWNPPSRYPHGSEMYPTLTAPSRTLTVGGKTAGHSLTITLTHPHDCDFA